MSVGLSAAEANAILDAFDGAWVQLHVGDPGAAGTANVAVETDRQQLSLAAAAGGAVANDVAMTWVGVSGAEDYTHLTIWTLAAAGVFRASGGMTANAVQVGDTFVIPVGDLDMTLPIAA